MAELIKPMHYEEAEDHLKRMGTWMANGINAATTAKRLYLEFAQRKGWAAFTDEDGEQLFADCESCVYTKLKSLGMTRQRAHQLAGFAEIIKDVDPVLLLPSGKAKEPLVSDSKGSPIVSEGLLRPLGKVKGTKARQRAMMRAIDLAAAKGEKVTASIVSKAVKVTTKRVERTEDEMTAERVKEILGRIERMCMTLNRMAGMDPQVSTLLTKAHGCLSNWEVPDEAEG